MVILFTDEEKEWLAMDFCNWHVKPGAPEEIRESIERKLKRNDEFSHRMRNGRDPVKPSHNNK